MARSLKVLWDHDAFPLWVDPGRAGARAIPLPQELRDEAQAWSDRMTALMWGPDGPDAPGWAGPDPRDLERVNADGRRLAVRVREALDESWVVSCFDEVARVEVEVERPPRAGSRATP